MKIKISRLSLTLMVIANAISAQNSTVNSGEYNQKDITKTAISQEASSTNSPSLTLHTTTRPEALTSQQKSPFTIENKTSILGNKLHLSLTKSQHIEVTIKDARGKMIKKIIDRGIGAGEHVFNLPLDGVCSKEMYIHITRNGKTEVITYTPSLSNLLLHPSQNILRTL